MKSKKDYSKSSAERSRPLADKIIPKSVMVDVILGRIFLCLVTLIGTFLFCEFLARSFLPLPFSNGNEEFNHTGNWPRPYVMSATKPDPTDINELGYIGPLPPLQKQRDAYRIFFLGGSTVFNGAPSIPKVVAGEFKKKGISSVEVYNFGATSSITIQDMIRILIDVSSFEPDLIVMYGGGNDLMEITPRVGYPHLFVFYESNPLWARDLKEYPLTDLVLFGSHVFRLFLSDYFENTFTKLPELWELANQENLETRMEKKVESYFTALKNSHKLAGLFNSDFLVVLQPMLDFKKNPSLEELKISGLDPRLIKMRENFLKRVKKTRNGFEFLNLSGFFDDTDKQVFTDSIHILQSQKSEIGKRLFKEIHMRYFTGRRAN